MNFYTIGLSHEQREMLPRLGSITANLGFYLAGGTALAVYFKKFSVQDISPVLYGLVYFDIADTELSSAAHLHPKGERNSTYPTYAKPAHLSRPFTPVFSHSEQISSFEIAPASHNHSFSPLTYPLTATYGHLHDTAQRHSRTYPPL